MPQYFGKLPINEQRWLTPKAVQSIHQDADGIYFQCGISCLKINVLAANLIRVRMSPTGEFLNRRSWAVALDDAEWEKIPFTVQETPETFEIKTDLLRVEIKRQNAGITCFDQANRPFAEDADMGMGWRMGAVAGWKRIAADEHFYGFGQRTRFLDQRSEVKTNWTVDALDYGTLTDEMYQAIPFFTALRPDICYGIFFNTTFWSQFDIGVEQPGVWKMETRGGELDYYIIYGSEPADILDTYTQLTGRMPLPPKWALGYHQCRWSYESEDVVRELAQEFRTRSIPCDVIHLDIDYMRGYRVFTWSPKRFPDPAKLISDLAQTGFNKFGGIPLPQR
jgi:alpha-glucosidase